MERTRVALAACVFLVAVSCRPEPSEQPTIVASFYPLAYAAERIAGPEWSVIDLTPPGTEAHDVEVTLEDREAIARANVLLYLGENGFQPQVEEAIADARGLVRGIDDDLSDPHLWLSPRTYLERIARTVLDALAGYAGDDDDTRYDRAFQDLAADLEAMDRAYASTLDRCRFRTMIVSHEAFGYLADDYGLEQFGLTGLVPEGEPTADRLQEARSIVERGDADAVFYEPTPEGARIGRQVATDLGIRALPLSPIESRPADGDFLGALRANLDALRGGLRCP